VSGQARLDAIDCIRGLMLICILVDHIDALTPQMTLSHVTLLGIGYSDAADVFVFCSGFIFGYAYSKNDAHGLTYTNLRKVASRTAQIYAAFVVCSFCVFLISNSFFKLEWSRAVGKLVSYCALSDQATNSGILCLYVVILPWLACLSWLAGSFTKIGILVISLSIYVLAQSLFLTGSDWPENWAFKPLAWQFLFVLAARAGALYRLTSTIVHSKSLLALACVVLVSGLIAKKMEIHAIHPISVQHSSVLQMLTDKSHWSIARAAHHLSVVYVVSYLIPIYSSFWKAECWEPIRICGRQPLSTFCTGILLTEVSSRMIGIFGGNLWTKIVLIVDAVLIQFAIAWLLHRFWFMARTSAFQRRQVNVLE
jgi:hypothetical protein